MTTKTIIENVRQIFPQVGLSQALRDLDNAQKIFVSETGLLTDRAELSDITTNVAWALPTGFKRLLDVTAYDSNGKPVYLEDRNLKYEIEFSKFYIYSTESTPITSIPTSINKIYIHYEKISSTIDDESDTIDIPLEYRGALEHYLLQSYFSKYPTLQNINNQTMPVFNPQMASWHLKRYNEIRIQAKRDYRAREKTDNQFINYDHAGHYILPRRADDGTYSTTTVASAISSLYDKYVRYTITSLIDGVQTAKTQHNYSTISASVTGDVLTLTSTGDFERDTYVIPNNTDVTYTWDNDSQITVTFPSGWNTIDIEIYELRDP